MEPREIIRNIEKSASLPLGKGYGVIGLPFRSEHVLAFCLWKHNFGTTQLEDRLS